jgi:cytochrome P450
VVAGGTPDRARPRCARRRAPHPDAQRPPGDANWAYLRPRRTGLRRRFETRLRAHLDRAEPGSLAGVLAETPAEPDVDPAGQVPHWLFAFDAAGIAAYRALARLASAPDARADLAYLQAAVLESVRLWPTTLVLLRDSTAAVDGAPAGTGYLIVTSFFQRARGGCFDPDLWLSGRAEEDWALVPFSRGPARCPGRELVLFTTGTMLAALRERYALTQLSTPANHAALRFSVSARDRSPVPG